jgi:hypothetical protein
MRNYETDYAGWAEDTAQAIKEGRWDDIDREALADEVISLSKSDRRAVRNRLTVLLMHLLKERFQPDRVTTSWIRTIEEQRRELRDLFDDSPSLRSPKELRAAITVAYGRARNDAAEETGLGVALFPEENPFSEDEILGA